jgi:hypothetical protein
MLHFNAFGCAVIQELGFTVGKFLYRKEHQTCIWEMTMRRLPAGAAPRGSFLEWDFIGVIHLEYMKFNYSFLGKLSSLRHISQCKII